jgi:hypothetical protein
MGIAQFEISSKHKSESLFQNLVIDIARIQTLGGIVLLGGDSNLRITTLRDTITTKQNYITS